MSRAGRGRARTPLAAAAVSTCALLVACSRPVVPSGVPLPAAPVTSLTRVASLDATGSMVGEALPNRVLARYGGRVEGGAPSLSWRTKTGASSVSPPAWPAYRSSAGRVFWLAGDGGTVALTGGRDDAAGSGTAALLVDASRADRIVATYDLR